MGRCDRPARHSNDSFRKRSAGPKPVVTRPPVPASQFPDMPQTRSFRNRVIMSDGMTFRRGPRRAQSLDSAGGLLRPLRTGRVAAILFSFVLLASACSHSQPATQPPPMQDSSSPPFHGPTDQPPSRPTKALPLGTFTLTGGASSCAPGQTCHLPFQVSCPGVNQSASGTLVVLRPGSSPRGLVMIFIGGGGVGLQGV